MHDELIKELRLLREELARAREENDVEVFPNHAPNEGTQEFKRKGHTYNNSLLGSAGLIFRGKSPKGRLQLILVILFPLLMALISLIHPNEPISRFDFWLMAPVMGIGFGFYNTVFLTTVEDRAKVKTRWKRHREFVAQWAQRNGQDISPSPSLAFRRKAVLLSVAFYLAAFWAEAVIFGLSPDLRLICSIIVIPIGVYFGLRISRPGGSLEELKLHLPKRLRV